MHRAEPAAGHPNPLPTHLHPPTHPPTGKRLEPLEEVVCEVEDEHAGEVIEAVTMRKGEVRVCVGVCGGGVGGGEVIEAVTLRKGEVRVCG